MMLLSRRSRRRIESVTPVLYRRDEDVASIDLVQPTLPPEVVWIDLLDPIQEEIAFLKRLI